MSASILKELAMTGRPTVTNEAAWISYKFEESYPNLYQLLTERHFNGEDRKPAKLSIFTNRGLMKVSIYLPSEARIGYVPVPDFEDLWGAVERALSSGGVDWQPSEKARKAR